MRGAPASPSMHARHGAGASFSGRLRSGSAVRCGANQQSGGRGNGYRFTRETARDSWREDILTDDIRAAPSGDGSRAAYDPDSDWNDDDASFDYGGWSGQAGQARAGARPRAGTSYDATQRSSPHRGDEPNGRDPRGGPAGASASTRLDLWPLTTDDLQSLFPASGTPAQYSYYWGSWDRAVQRIAVSLLITLMASNSNAVVAAGALSYCFWGPILQSVARNLSVKKFPYGAFWTAQVLEIGFARRRGRRGAQPTEMSRIRVGEPGAADVMVEVAYERAHDFVRVGDPAVLVVLSNSPTLQSFKAVRDVYLPFSRLWLVDYPFVSRTGFQRAFLNLNHGRRQGGVGPGQDPRGGDGQQSERREYSGFAR